MKTYNVVTWWSKETKIQEFYVDIINDIFIQSGFKVNWYAFNNIPCKKFDPKNTTVLVMPPIIIQEIIKKNSFIKKSNLVGWTFDPMIGDSEINKFGKVIRKAYTNYKGAISLLDGDVIKCMFTYSASDLKYFKKHNVNFLPAVFSDKFEYLGEVLKEKKQKILILGNTSVYRVKTISYIVGKGYEVDLLTSHTLVSLDSRKKEISKYRVSLDIPRHEPFSDNVSAIRLGLLYGSRCVVATKNNLDEIGFKDGEHYIKYDSIDGLLEKIDGYSDDELSVMAENGLAHIKENFNIKDKLLKIHFEKMGL